jgi:hypothetical protein
LTGAITQITVTHEKPDAGDVDRMRAVRLDRLGVFKGQLER